ncbi:MAG: hypothetical protein Q8Q09_23025 [Deltaproteobacteria bacterium]|nr:hypothetical protein [Deltaproteobacteria bacterium]
MSRNFESSRPTSRPVRAHSVCSRVALLGAVTLCSLPAWGQGARGVRWPVQAVTGQSDPLSALRWPNGGWTCTLSLDSSTPRAAQRALLLLDRRVQLSDQDASVYAARAVVLRLLHRLDDSQRSLDRARQLDPTTLLDPDVMLTEAFLHAARGRYVDAVTRGRAALPRLSGPLGMRIEASVEIARWSLMRGAEGADDALALLREATLLSPTPALRSTMVFALVVAGRVEQAQRMARSGALLPASQAAAQPSRGTLSLSLVRASAAVALSLSAEAARATEALDLALADRALPAAIRETVVTARARAASAPRTVEAPAPVLRALHGGEIFDDVD